MISVDTKKKELVGHSCSLETIINLIAATTTSAGLEVYARLDDGVYPDKLRVPEDRLRAINLHDDPFRPEWNYTIKPKH